jgi:uncharacterized protein YceH (UPF0502 family)
MSADTSTAPPRTGPWPALDLHERRILGVLVEKAKTTPDAYPLSINALMTGCNQKSNRDPILELDEDEVDDALQRLKARELVVKVIGGRVDRWRHLLYETWHVDKIELAILAELLLRGPQTEGELRGRASRMEPIEDLETLRSRLKPLVERGLVVYLTPEERRGAMLTHGFHPREELDQLKTIHAAGTPAGPVSAPAQAAAPAPAPARPDGRVEELAAALAVVREEVAALRQQLGEVRATLATTQQELRELRRSLGG